MADVVLGCDDLEGYLHDGSYFGATIGRYANRIARGRFTLDGRTCRLALNNGPNSLHGGDAGFDKMFWDGRGDGRRVRLHLTSPDGAGGYPGTLHVEVTWEVENRDLRIDYRARCDAPTVLNLTNHAYFNLAGIDREAASILDHVLTIDADRYTPVDPTLIPTGALAAVSGTPLDFRVPTAIGTRIGAADTQLERAGGYDHNFVLAETGSFRRAARVVDPGSGRALEVWTTQPGLQFYSGNFLDGTVRGKHGVRYGHRTGLCLETQHFPDSPNHPGFPSTVLRPGQSYEQTTVYRFSAG
jgi:aldose 1-epimerase